MHRGEMSIARVQKREEPAATPVRIRKMLAPIDDEPVEVARPHPTDGSTRSRLTRALLLLLLRHEMDPETWNLYLETAEELADHAERDPSSRDRAFQAARRGAA